ncbi:SHOCT domain-containing protein [Halorussus litoreus]|uniref:SHOCT domain-containing protein n=1 Tax=Halorussus litoreus TaxID=1710536 RepID=UPI000E228C58|nr:SHOCT domain-containing protein [Halorussus litoreus]
MAETALERGRENAIQIVSTFVTGTWILALIAGFDWWIWFMLFGYMVLIPTVSTLFGDDEEWEEENWDADEDWQADEGWRGHPGAWWGDANSGDETEETPDAKPTTDNRDALETLRTRYARGELTDEQFERKVERLLETETLEDVEDHARGSASGTETGGEHAERASDETSRRGS